MRFFLGWLLFLWDTHLKELTLLLQIAIKQQDWTASTWDIFQSNWTTILVSLYFFVLSVVFYQDYNTSMRKQPRIHLFQLRLLPWTMFHSLQCTMGNNFVAGSLISLVHVHWNKKDHLWKGNRSISKVCFLGF